MSAPIYQFTDPNILGVQDDGSPEGISKVKILSGDFVKVRMNNLYTSSTGTVTVAYIDVTNPDGSGMSATISPTGGVFKAILVGRSIGIRIRRTSATMPDIGVIIDGMPYYIPKWWLENRVFNVAGSGNDTDTSIMIDTDLDDTIPHTVVVYNYALQNIGFILYGYVAEAKAGYIAPPAANYPVPITLTTSYVAFGKTGGYSFFRKISYFNSEAIVTGTAQAGAASSITLASGDGAVANAYVGYTVFIKSGTGAGQTKYIVSNNASTKVTTVDSAWITTPDSTSIYAITPPPRLVTLRQNSIIVWQGTVAAQTTIESIDYGRMPLGTTSSTAKWDQKADVSNVILATIITA